MVTKILENKWHCFILILLATTASTGSLTACPPPPECDTPDRYVLWASENGSVFAQSEEGESVYLNYYGSSPYTIKYTLVPQNNTSGQWFIWADMMDYSYHSSVGCGYCSSRQCSFTYSGGMESIRFNNSIVINYNNPRQSLSGYVRGTHNGWDCYKNGYGSYQIQAGQQVTMNVYIVKVDIKRNGIWFFAE